MKCILVFATAAWLLVSAGPAPGAEPLPGEGELFDPGATMNQPAEGAPPELLALVSILGKWDVTYETFEGDSVVTSARGEADIGFLNRGHGYLERLMIPDFNGAGDDLATIDFLTFAPGPGVWLLGVADGYRENVTLYDGAFQDTDLVLGTAGRPLGGPQVVHRRAAYRERTNDRFVFTVEESRDGGVTWTKKIRKSYGRYSRMGMFAILTGTGRPHPDLSPEARLFDFILGEWDEAHHMTFPNGNEARFPVNGTAVRVLDGRGVLEFSWYDVDPNLPDAATSIVRIYNRAMRRWECMYTTNRFNGILHFGGAAEGDRIVLHQFAADASDAPLRRWIFEDIQPDSYRWHAESSNDRGRTFESTWEIQAQRKP